MTKIEILADLSGWLVRSGYLALKVVSSSGEKRQILLVHASFTWITWIRNILAEEIAQQAQLNRLFISITAIQQQLFLFRIIEVFHPRPLIVTPEIT